MGLSASGSRRIAGYDGVAGRHRYSASQERTRSSSDLAWTVVGSEDAVDTSRKRIGSGHA
jgi:hypothetical protein